MGGLKKTDDWIKLARELRDAGVLFLLLTGGEVFIYPEFRRLYEALSEMGFSITINTNATLIDEETVQWLKINPPQCISISLYGASDATYEAICGKKSMFTQVNRAIDLLISNHICIELKTVFTPLNVHDLEACWKYAMEKGVFYETTTYAFPPVRRTKPEEQIRFCPEQAVEYQFMRNSIILSEEEQQIEISRFLQKYRETRCNSGSTLYGFTCGASNSSCWITWNGKMTPCAMLNTPYSLPFEIGFLPAWEELKKKSDQILMSPKCSYCDKREVCHVCPASNYAETGRFDCSSPYHCEMTRLKLEKMNDYMSEFDNKNATKWGKKCD